MQRRLRLRRRRLLLTLATAVLTASLLSALACQPVEKVFTYTFGSTSAASTHYSAALVLANLINSENPDIKVAVGETGATHDNLIRAQTGKLDGGFAVNWDGMAMAYNGTTIDEYVDYGKWPELRMLPGYVYNYVYVVIVDDGPGAEIDTLYDLHGQKFSAGITGSVTEFNIRRQLEALGIEPDWVSASYPEVVAMAKELEIVGFARSTTKFELDSSMLDLKSEVDIKILGWPEDQLQTALMATPGTSATWIPQNAIQGLPMPGFHTLGHTTGVFVTTDIPQDVGYRMVKAYVDRWDEFARAWPAAGNWTPLETDLALLGDITELVEMPPLHAGVVQLMIERDYHVPSRLIGPEYDGNSAEE